MYGSSSTQPKERSKGESSRASRPFQCWVFFVSSLALLFLLASFQRDYDTNAKKPMDAPVSRAANPYTSYVCQDLSPADVAIAKNQVIMHIENSDHLDISFAFTMTNDYAYWTNIIHIGNTRFEEWPAVYYSNRYPYGTQLDIEFDSERDSSMATHFAQGVSANQRYEARFVIDKPSLKAYFYLDGVLKHTFHIPSSKTPVNSPLRVYASDNWYREGKGTIHSLKVCSQEFVSMGSPHHENPEWDNHWDGTLDVRHWTSPLCKVRSIHGNFEEDRRYAFWWCPWSLSGASWKDVSELPETHWESDFTRNCREDQFLMGVYSWHDDDKEDRKFKWRCGTMDAGYPMIYRQDNCEWEGGWVNAYDGAMDFTCDANKALAGVKSQHSEHHDDRRFNFKCCMITRLKGKFVDLGTPQYPYSEGNYDNGWDAVLDVKRDSAVCELRSPHDNHYEDRRYAFGWCAPNVAGGNWGSVNELSETDWDASWTRVCPYDQFIVGVYSWHDNGREDRRFKWRCAEYGVNLPDKYVQSNCDWDYTWVNEMEHFFVKRCPDDKVMAGVRSYHDNGKEDRRFKFKCCTIGKVVGSPLSLKSPQYPYMPYIDGVMYENQFFETIFDLTRDGPLCEVHSKHDNSKEDRRFAFGSCPPDGTNAGFNPQKSLPDTGLDAEWTRECPFDEFIVGVLATYDTFNKDRWFRWHCAKYPGYVQGLCEWDEDWINDWDAAFAKTCPDDKVLTGVHSVHDNFREDRRFRFQCCKMMSQT